MCDMKRLLGDELSYEVKIVLNVLCAWFNKRVLHHEDCAFAISWDS